MHNNRIPLCSSSMNLKINMTDLNLIGCYFLSVAKRNQINSSRMIQILKGKKIWIGQLWNKASPITSFLILPAVICFQISDYWPNLAKFHFPYLQLSLECRTPADHLTYFLVCFQAKDQRVDVKVPPIQMNLTTLINSKTEKRVDNIIYFKSY